MRGIEKLLEKRGSWKNFGRKSQEHLRWVIMSHFRVMLRLGVPNFFKSQSQMLKPGSHSLAKP